MVTNIICNNCVGGRIYEQLHEQFNNPFIWCRILKDDVISMIDNWEKIDFSNIEIVKGIKDHTFGLRIDGKFTVYYTHYVKDNKYKKPTKMVGTNCELDVHYENMEKYTVDKYMERLKRMNLKNVLFVFVQRENCNFTNFEDILTLQKKLIEKKMKSVIICDILKMKNHETNENKILIKEGILKKSTAEIAKIILKQIKI